MKHKRWHLHYNVNLTNQASATTYKNAMPQSNNACTQALNARLGPTELTTRLTKLIKLTTCKCMQSKRTWPHRPHKSVDKTDKLTTCKCIQSKRTTWPHGADKSVDKTHDCVGLMKPMTCILSKPQTKDPGTRFFNDVFSKGPSQAKLLACGP